MWESTEALEIFDSHAHIFAPPVIANVSRLNGLVASLGLEMDAATRRMDKASLMSESAAAGVRNCLLLPTAPASGVRKTNGLFLGITEGEERLFTAGTLHPSAPGMEEELQWLSSRGVRAIKLCSFSQAFDLQSEETFRLFDTIRRHNLSGKPKFFVILDTFFQADIYFGSPREHLTTPEKLGRLAAAFPEIDFVGAHMGGLSAPFQNLETHLAPRDNLYLDTSNAAHVLSRREFLRLAGVHGPDRILFGTDWPWFGHKREVELIRGLLQDAGFSFEELSRIFSGNVSRLLGTNAAARDGR